jgi:hypothetical protein
MPIIRNKLDQKILVNLNSEKNINLFAKGTAEISEDELSSSHLKSLIAKGDIVVNTEKRPENKEEAVQTGSSYVSKARK